jgi:hypothetical protein
MYQLAHIRRTKAVQQRLIRANARDRLLQLVDEDGERGELAWRHRTNHRQETPYHKTGTLHLRGGAQSAISWNSKNVQDDALVQDEYEERCHCSYCPWFDHLSTHCKSPHFLCSTQTLGWCHVPRHHRYFCNQMPDTCPYRGRCKHANGHYLTCQRTAWCLSLQDRQTEYDHLNAGCNDLCKGEMSRAGVAMQQAITQVVLDEFEGAGPSYTPVLLHPTMIMSLATTRDQTSMWKHYFEGRVVISSASGMERGEVFYRPMDWLGSHDPMTHYDYASDSLSGLDD